MKVQSPCRLRDRRLTFKPRITRCASHYGFWVDRLVPSTHPTVRAFPETKCVDTFEEAIAQALKWAGPKEKP